MGDQVPPPEAGFNASQVAAALQAFDTPTVVNAIETFGVQLRNEGYVGPGVACRLPHLPPTVGYAFTLRVRTSSPPMGGGTYTDRSDWWEAVEQVPRPRIVVVEDADKRPGAGAFIGGLHAEILHTLGCVGCVTNGAVRDLKQAEALGFQLFAGNVTVSHAYTHVVAVGETVRIDGLAVGLGDLLHGDVHGVVRVPAHIAADVPAVAGRMMTEEREITRYCRSGEFSLAGLRELLRRQLPKI
ncbi:MAG: RraA family protein [Rhodospirillales bacterium]|nr:RraA family protein [Acetobacter sp.]